MSLTFEKLVKMQTLAMETLILKDGCKPYPL